MKLISEEIQDAQYLVEETNGKKSYKIKGVFLQSDIKNRNGRIYENDILTKEVDRYSKEFIDKNSLEIVNEAESPNGKIYFFKDHEGIIWHLKDYENRDWTNNW